MSEVVSQSFTGQVLAHRTSISYDTVLSRLDSTLSPQGAAPETTIAASLASPSREALETAFKPYLGPHDFMQFRSLDHSKWIKVFDVGEGLRLKRITLGNPLIAIGILQRDLRAGLFVPVEILVRELDKDEGGGTEIR